MSTQSLNSLTEAFGQLPEVLAFVLGGSRASDSNDALSDFDLYIYCESPISRQVRKQIISEHCAYLELANRFWEEEDDFVLNDGTVVELIYRQMDEFAQGIDATVRQGQATVGYSTCFWFSLLNAKVLYERGECFSQLQQKYSVVYPSILRQNIIDKNLPLLLSVIPAYPDQINKSVQRGDRVSVQHRITAYLASYFDVLFAVNELPHPGEKRLLSFALQHCQRLPVEFEASLSKLLSPKSDDELSSTLRFMSEQIETLVLSQMKDMK
ncbi:DUF4037 domain-containing protein [Vibrio mediterranei]|uniref:DUF4037 domain-containing protein n=1 Tax=Vibrio mediterranei TaxID=689 RepID=UPI0040689D54